MSAEDQEGQIHALQVLQYEDEDHDQCESAGDERSPGPAEARPSLARIRFLSRFCILRRLAAHQLVIYTPSVAPSQVPTVLVVSTVPMWACVIVAGLFDRAGVAAHRRRAGCCVRKAASSLACTAFFFLVLRLKNGLATSHLLQDGLC